jgi:hypothetical protein
MGYIHGWAAGDKWGRRKGGRGQLRTCAAGRARPFLGRMKVSFTAKEYARELRLDRVVAASVSEWMSCHSLTLAATPEMKKMRENWHRDGLIKCLGACPGDLYADPPAKFFRTVLAQRST